MKRRNALLATAAALAASMMTPAVWGQAGYPDRPVKIIVPYAVGVSPDIVARLLSERLGPALGRPVIIDNRPGAGGMLGAEAAAAMPPDGYNLLFTVKGVMAIVPHVYPNAKFNALKDFKTLTEFRADLDPNGATGNSWHGVFAPAGTPDAIIGRLNTELVKIVKTPDVQSRLRTLGLTPTGTSAEHLASQLASDFGYWGKIVRELNVKVE